MLVATGAFLAWRIIGSWAGLFDSGYGRLLLVNTIWTELLSPWLIRSYRDLFRNVGYEIEIEETLTGTKETVELEILVSLFGKAGRGLARASA